MTDPRTVYGLEVEAGAFGPRGVIGCPETAPIGNLVLRVGQEHQGTQGWYQTQHVVLTPAEADEFVAAIQEAMAAVDPERVARLREASA